MFTNRISVILMVILLLLLTLARCGDDNNSSIGPNIQYEASETVHLNYQFGTQTKVDLSAVSGTIEIHGIPMSSDSIYVDYTKKVRSNVSQEDAENRLNNLDVDVTNSTPIFYVETLQPQDTEGRNYTIDYDIRMPLEMALKILQVAGVIDVESISNKVEITNVTGNVNLYDLSDTVIVSNVTGSINLNTVGPNNNLIDLQIVTGSIFLDIPTSTSADFQANVVTGSININNLVLNNPNIQNYSVTGTLGAGDGSIHLSTITGNINVNGF